MRMYSHVCAFVLGHMNMHVYENICSIQGMCGGTIESALCAQLHKHTLVQSACAHEEQVYET